MCKDSDLKISVGIIALNEEEYLPDLLSDILKQDYPKNKIELIFVDSESKDSTLDIFKSFNDKYSNLFSSIQILKNIGTNQASGWNTVIKNYTGDALIRIDAHARIPNNFVYENVEALNRGENVVGGLRSVKNKSESLWNNTLWLAEMSLFGSSIAGYRRSEKECYVNSMFHACYRRKVLNEVGLFNEELGRTEDNEFHYRIRNRGFRLFYTPKIMSYQLIRPNLRKMMKQKYSNGYWIGITLFKSPHCLEIYHFIPFLFVVALILSSIFALFINYIPLSILLIAYFTFDFINTLFCIKYKEFNITSVLLICIFPLLHVSYGIGTLFGIFKHNK